MIGTRRRRIFLHAQGEAQNGIVAPFLGGAGLGRYLVHRLLTGAEFLGRWRLFWAYSSEKDSPEAKAHGMRKRTTIHCGNGSFDIATGAPLVEVFVSREELVFGARS